MRCLVEPFRSRVINRAYAQAATPHRWATIAMMRSEVYMSLPDLLTALGT